MYKRQIDGELKSRDAAIFFPEMDASVSSEKELRLAVEAVRMKTEEERLQQAKLALRAERHHRAWTERWPCHADGTLYCYITSYVALFRARIAVYSTNSWYQVPGIFPGYVHTRSSRSPQPESSAREHRTRASALDSEMDDTLSLPELPREPEHPSVTLGCRAFTGTAEVNQVHVKIKE